MKKAYVLSWIFCWLNLLGYAQSGKDYLLTLNQDTLYGKILTEPNGLAPITFIYEKQRMNYTPASIRFLEMINTNTSKHFKVKWANPYLCK